MLKIIIVVVFVEASVPHSLSYKITKWDHGILRNNKKNGRNVEVNCNRFIDSEQFTIRESVDAGDSGGSHAHDIEQ